MPGKARVALQVCLVLSLAQTCLFVPATALSPDCWWDDVLNHGHRNAAFQEKMDAQRTECLKRFRGYYTGQSLMNEEDMDQLERICCQPLPVTFRLAGKLSNDPSASDRLHAQLLSLVQGRTQAKVSNFWCFCEACDCLY
jgi:hypothetical protein